MASSSGNGNDDCYWQPPLQHINSEADLNAAAATSAPDSALARWSSTSDIELPKQQQQQQQQPQQQSIYRYVLGREIGVGSYSKVLVGHGPDGPVALKQIRVSNSSGLPYSTIRELVILKPLSKLRHPNIVSLIEVMLQKHGKDYYMFMVFELLHCDLQDYLSRHRLGQAAVRSLGHQLMLGLEFLHRHRILHRDLKPQNCLLNQQCTVLKIADFNMARVCSSEKQMTAVVSTLWYRSPEVLLACGYSSPTDVWSAGCILFEMATSGRPLFNAQDEAPMLRQILALLGVPSADAWPARTRVARQQLANEFPAELTPMALSARLAAKLPTGLVSGSLDGGYCGYTMGRWSLASLLGERLLRFSPASRCTATEALRHPYFAAAAVEAASPDAAAEAAAADVVESVVDKIGINSPCPMPPPMPPVPQQQQQQRQTLFPVPMWALGPGGAPRGRASMPAAPFASSLRQKRPLADLSSTTTTTASSGASRICEDDEDDAAWGSDEQLEEFSTSESSHVDMAAGSSGEVQDQLAASAFDPNDDFNTENDPPAADADEVAVPQACSELPFARCGKAQPIPPPPPPLQLRHHQNRRLSL